MSNILSSLLKTVISGFILLFIIMLIISSASDFYFDYHIFLFFRWIHVLSGVMWIGLLWYFNFVQIPSMPKSLMNKSQQFQSLLLLKPILVSLGCIINLLLAYIRAHQWISSRCSTLDTSDGKIL